MSKSIICPNCGQPITDSGYEYGTEIRKRCVKCSCGTNVIVIDEEPEILRQKMDALMRK
jgi:phosphoribosyl 1,2-cyclic phosphodiesterase